MRNFINIFMAIGHVNLFGTFFLYLFRTRLRTNSIYFRRYYLFLFCLFVSYFRYIGTAQLVLNGFLKSQGVPQNALLDPQRPSETVSNLLDYVARQHLHTKVSTIVYVKPAVSYVKDLFKLGKARGLLQKFNATELSDKLTDTVNLEVRNSWFFFFTEDLN